MDFGGCYLLQLNADQGTNKYKVGQSKNVLKRLKSVEYRNAVIYESIEVLRYQPCEHEILKVFRERFEWVRNDITGGYGLEYFRGDINEMRKTFKEICMKYNSEEKLVKEIIKDYSNYIEFLKV